MEGSVGSHSLLRMDSRLHDVYTGMTSSSLGCGSVIREFQSSVVTAVSQLFTGMTAPYSFSRPAGSRNR
jgi:hypothetical protein